MESTTEIIAFVGLEDASARLGVDRDTIRRQAARPQLPAAWYDTLEQLAGRPLPRSLFTFKGSSSE